MSINGRVVKKARVCPHTEIHVVIEENKTDSSVLIEDNL